MTREDVAEELYWHHYTAFALEAACNGGLVGNPRDCIVALEDVLSLDVRESSELLYTYIMGKELEWETDDGLSEHD